MVICITTITLEQQLFIIIIATDRTRLFCDILFVVIFNEHGWVDIRSLSTVADTIGRYDRTLIQYVSRPLKYLVGICPELTSNLDNELHLVEALTAYRTTVGPFDPWLEAFIM